VGEVATAVGVKDYDGLRRKLGRKWAYELRETIMKADDAEWRGFLEQSEGNRTRNNNLK
jgi:hypothetical protein